MNTFLLTWNPNRWPWDMSPDLLALKEHGYFDDCWSCRTKRIQPGDRVFLLRQGLEPRGILASGQARSLPHKKAHWDETRNDQTRFVDVRFDALLIPEEDGVLPLEQLREGPLAKVHWGTQFSGISIEPLAASLLEQRWRAFLEQRGQSPIASPEEIATPAIYFEGASRTVAVNAYERDPRARRACIQHYGTSCFVCGFDFSEKYGALGEGFIHVHHIVPLADVGGTYAVDPVRDLRPVCPNCHAMIHRRADVLSIDAVQRVLRK